MKAFIQFRYYFDDYGANIGKYWFRGFYIWMTMPMIGLFIYRLERCLFLILGDSYRFIRVPFLPLLSFIQAFTQMDVNYHANLLGWVKILHNAMGVVISGQSIIGKNLTLIGGNVIGAKCKGRIVIGNNCTMGANAVIIGPVALGDNVSIGASACVVKDAPSDVVLVGVPAKII